MRDIDAKKTRVDRHIAVTATAVTATDKNADLKARLEALNGHMTTTKTRLLARISECSSLSADAEQFNRKYSEIKDMFEKRRSGDESISLIQHKVFQDICSRILSTYVSDDTSEVRRAAAEVSALCNKTEKGKLVVSQKSPQQQQQLGKVDSLMAEFTSWLSKSESSAKELLCDDVLSSAVFHTKLSELEDSIVSMDCEFNMLRSQVPEGACQPLQQAKIEDISRRWKALQNSMLSLKAKRDSFEQQDEAAVSIQLVSETNAWVSMQRGFLNDLPAAEDAEDLRRRASVLDKLSRDVKSKLNQISAGHQGDKEVRGLSDLEDTLRALAAKVETTNEETVKALELREKLQSCVRDLTHR